MSTRQTNAVTFGRTTRRGYSAGVHSFARCQNAHGRPELLPIHSSSIDIAAALVDWINYCLINEHKIHCFKTITTYITHIKDAHITLCASNQSHHAYNFVWPTKTRAGYDCLPLQAALNNAAEFYIEFEGRGRTALTCGIMKLFRPHMDFNNPVDLLSWNAMLLTRAFGVRTNEILPTTTNSSNWAERILFTTKNIELHPKSSFLSVFNGKANERQIAVSHSVEWWPEVQYYGNEFDVFNMLNKILLIRGNRPDFFPVLAIGSYTLTYSKFYNRLKQLSTLINFSSGKIGPHSGRIYRATIMHHRKHNKKTIKMRGRWKGKSWEIYTRALLFPRDEFAPWIRLGHIDTDLRDCPIVFECTRSAAYFDTNKTTWCTRCHNPFLTTPCTIHTNRVRQFCFICWDNNKTECKSIMTYQNNNTQ